MSAPFRSLSDLFLESESMEVRLWVNFAGRDILWRVSEETITDHFDDPQGQDVPATARRHFDTLSSALCLKSAFNAVEADISVLLTSGEFPVYRPLTAAAGRTDNA